jgi:hypothetical protein
MRSPEPQVVGEALADDAHTATPLREAVEGRATSPPVADTRVDTPPRVLLMLEELPLGMSGR